ncbi:MAG TPA: tetraacyldisaccharide 4'-kinase [Mariniphaga sp.]|nr:tetraacyldisaccharide 4'-kinase [Mariniphaga sp.]
MRKILLYPFSLIYGLIVYFRNLFYDLNIFKSKEFEVTVISIGNITVGGTGKTPHVEYLVDLLREKFNVATLSRGYKRKTRGFHLVSANSTVREVGDEPLQIKRKFPDITVGVCEDRVVGVEKLLKTDDQNASDVIVLDDAFQHRKITPVINILLIDYNRPLKDDLLLPAGSLRESAAQLRRANIIIFSKCPPEEVTPIMRRVMQNDIGLKPYQSMFFTTYEYGAIQPMFDGPVIDEDFYEAHSYGILIVSGIAYPRLIPEYLKQFATEIDMVSFPDHHNFTSGDIGVIMNKLSKLKSQKKIIITTEKDAIRFRDLSDLNETFKNMLYYLPVKVKFLDEEGKVFNKKILNYVGENKSNLELHRRQVQRPS